MIHRSEGTYSKLVPDELTKARITKITDFLPIGNPVNPNQLHVTVVYSREVCESIRNIEVNLPLEASGKRFDIFTTNSGANCLVLVLDSPAIENIHYISRDDHGATHDHPEYHPHITFSYDYPPDIPPPSNEIAAMFDNLIFDSYVVEPLQFEWKAD